MAEPCHVCDPLHEGDELCGEHAELLARALNRQPEQRQPKVGPAERPFRISRRGRTKETEPGEGP